MDALLAHEGAIRLAAFVLAAGTLALAERRRPRRGDARPAARQLHNLGLLACGALLLRLAFPLLAVAAAIRAQAAGIGLFHALPLPAALEFGLALLLLDLAIYAQHRAMHAWPPLWQLHRVHHADTAFDLTLGVRFHPLELALSMAWKLLLVALLGPSPWAVLAYEALLAAGSLFAHADLALPPRLERALRRVLVTPDLHRVHHSPERDQADANYGTLLVCWDRLFRTWRARPRAPHESMAIGLHEFRAAREQTLWALLLQPLRRADGRGGAAGGQEPGAVHATRSEAARGREPEP